MQRNERMMKQVHVLTKNNEEVNLPVPVLTKVRGRMMKQVHVLTKNDDVRYEEGSAAILISQDWESPDVAQP